MGGDDDRSSEGPTVFVRVSHASGRTLDAGGFVVGDGLVLTSRLAVAGATRIEVGPPRRRRSRRSGA